MCRIVVVKALVALCQLRMLLLVIAPSPHAVSLSFNCKDGKVEPVGIVFNTPHSAVPAPGQTASNLSFFLSYAFSQVGGHLRFLCVSLNRIRKKKKRNCSYSCSLQSATKFLRHCTVTSENIRIHTPPLCPPLSPPLKVGVFVVF